MHKSLIFFVCWFIGTFLYANTDLDEQFLGAIQSSESNVNDCINVITGTFFINETDLNINAIEPISVHRSYSSSDTLNYEGGWHFFPHTTMTAPSFGIVSICEPSGQVVTYVQDENDSKKYFAKNHEETPGLVNTSQGAISGKTNIKNNSLEVDHKNRYATLTTGDGTKRVYRGSRRNNNKWNLEKEVLPNGNVIFYTFNKEEKLINIKTTNPSQTKTYASLNLIHGGKKSKNFAAYSTDGQRVDYHFWEHPKKEYRKNYYLCDALIEYESYQTYQYEMGYKRYSKEEKKKKSKKKIKLNRSRGPYVQDVKVKGIHALNIHYYNPGYNPLPDTHNFFLKEAKDSKAARVRFIQMPRGPNGELVPTHTFHYNLGKKTTIQGNLDKSGSTDEYDSDNNLTKYHFSKNLRFEKIEYYYKHNNQQILHSCQKFYWGKGEDQTQLICKTLEDAHHNVVLVKYYRYDPFGNVLQESLYGNLSGHCKSPIILDKKHCPIANGIEGYHKYYTYSQDGFNLTLSEKEDNGNKVLYQYKRGTNLPTAKYTCHKNKILLRTFYEYNADNILIREIIDDGSSFDKNNLSDLTQRIIRKIHVKNSSPALNFPEVVEEYYWDKNTRKNIFLGKRHLHYSEKAEVVQEDLYDANNQYRYSTYTKYNKAGKVLENHDPIGRKTIFQYDNFGNAILAKEEKSRVTKKVKYDQVSRPISLELHPDVGSKITTNYKYDIKNNLIEKRDCFNNTTQYEYDAFGRCTTKYLPKVLDSLGNPYTPKIVNTYDIFGNLISQKDPKGYITKSSYNIYKKPIETIKHDGSTRKNIYNLDGSLKTSIAEDGVQTHYQYDGLGQVISKKIFSSYKVLLSEEKWKYKGKSLIAYTAPSGSYIKNTYDGAGRKIEEIQNNETKTSYEYDALGHVFSTTTTSLSDPTSGVKIFSICDIMGRVVEERQEDLSHNIFVKVLCEYDVFDNKKKITRFVEGKESCDVFFYDSFDRITKQIDPLEYETSIKYINHYLTKQSLHNSQKIIKDPGGYFFIQNIDALGRTVSTEIKNQKGQTLSKEEFFYDRAGNKTKQLSYVYINDILQKTKTTRWSYGYNHEILSIIEAADTPEQKITKYTYDIKKRRTSLIKPNGIVIYYKYDNLDRMTRLYSSDKSCDYSFSYDLAHRPIEIKDMLTGKLIQKKYDLFGYLIEEKLDCEKIVKRRYDYQGRCLELIIPDGSSIKYEYNAVWLLSVNRYDRNGAHQYSHRYVEYDNSCNLLKQEMIKGLGHIDTHVDLLERPFFIQSPYAYQEIKKFDPRGLVMEVSRFSEKNSSYDYDGLKQLKKEEGSFKNAYLHDSHSNRLEKDGEKYHLNERNEVLISPKATFTYDKNGNPLEKKVGNETIYFHYDALDRLTDVIEPNHMSIHYTYDGEHRRTSKSVSYYQDGQFIEDTYLNYLYSDANEIGSMEDDGKIVEFKVLGLGKGAEIGAAVAMELDSKVYGVINDLFGNIYALISTDEQKLVEYYIYNAFGEEEIFDSNNNKLDSSCVDNPWRYFSKRKDEETNFTYFGRRYYDPDIGRWLTPDPEGFMDGPNLYAFVLNNPLSRLDFFGLASDLSGLTRDMEKMNNSMNSVVAHQSTVSFWQNTLKSQALNGFSSPITNHWFYADYQKYNLDYNPTHFDNPKVEVMGDPKNATVIASHINGIANTYSDFKENITAIYEASGKKALVIGIWNPTHGTSRDLLRAFMEKKNIMTKPAISLQAVMQTCLDAVDAGSASSYMHSCHSEGVAITKLTLEQMSDDYKNLSRKHLNLSAFGGAAILEPEMGKNVMNYIATDDPVPFLTNSSLAQHAINSAQMVLSQVAHQATYNKQYSNQPSLPSHIKLLEPKIKTFLGGHPFLGPTYRKALYDRINKIMGEQHL